MRLPTLFSRSLLAVLAAGAFAGSAGALEVYAGVGTVGASLGVAQAIDESHGVRAQLNGMKVNRSWSSSEADYDAQLKLASVGLFYDWHPWAGSFRLGPGVLAGRNELTGQGVANGSAQYVINGIPYSAAGQSLELTVKFPGVMPAFVIGGGHTGKSGLNWFWDLGAAFGRPVAQLTASPTLASLAASDIAAEQARAQDKANRWRVFPVLGVGIGWTF